MAEHGGFSGFHGNFVEQHFHAKFRKHSFDKIVFAHRNATGHEQNIVLEAALDLASEILKIIPPDT